MVSRSRMKAASRILPDGDRSLCVKCHHFTARRFNPGVFILFLCVCYCILRITVSDNKDECFLFFLNLTYIVKRDIL